MRGIQKFYQYAELTTRKTKYAEKMLQLKSSIFGELPANASRKSHKVYRILSEEPFDKQEKYWNYYPRHVEANALTLKLREYGLYRDEHEDWREEMLRIKELRGKYWLKNTKIKNGTWKE